MRTTVFLAAMLAAGWAQADWVPTLASNNHVVTISYGGGTGTYREGARNYDGRIYQFAAQMRSAHAVFENALNTVVAAKVAEQGITFRGGSITGNLHARMQPIGNNTILMSLDGINYAARSSYSGKRLGFITFDCVNTFTANNISITGQYGANNGALAPSVGLNSNVNSSTDCDSNLSWILPIVGDLLVNKATGILDGRLEDGARQAMNNVKDKLLFVPDAIWGVGLNNLLTSSENGVRLPDGTPFNLGLYVANNMDYVLGNSQFDMQFGRGLEIKTKPGTSAPPDGPVQANILLLTVTSPAMTFSIQISEEAIVRWNWKCPANSPQGGCREP